MRFRHGPRPGVGTGTLGLFEAAPVLRCGWFRTSAGSAVPVALVFLNLCDMASSCFDVMRVSSGPVKH